MNRAYRLVWSAASNACVPAPEFARGRGKTTTGVRSAGATSGALSFIAGCALLYAGSVFATPIVPDGRTQTTVTTHGSVTDINTQTVRGANAFNSFQRFNVQNGQTANLHLPAGTANLLNLVRGERSHIDGILNAYKDGRIGGNVFFLNPNGIVIGAGGVLNAGNLALATPTPQFMDALIDPSGRIGDAAAADLLAGRIPLTDSGLIQVKGRINALGAAGLHAGQVLVDAGARVVAGPRAQVEFGDLVNIDGIGLAGGVEVKDGVVKIVAARDIAIAGRISADGGVGVNGGQIDIHAGTDLRLAAGAEITADGQGIASSGGRINAYAEGSATLDANARIGAVGGASGDGGFVEFSAGNTVNIRGGSIEAGARAGAPGTVRIDPAEVVWSGSSNDVFSAGANYEIEATKRIELNDVVISTRQTKARPDGQDPREWALNGASQGNSYDITLKAPQVSLKNGTKLLAHADGVWTGGKVTIEASDESALPTLGWATASARIDVENAVIKAADIELKARSTIDSQFVYSGDDPLGSAIDVSVTTAEQAAAFLASMGGVKLVVSDVNAKAAVNVGTQSSVELDATGSVKLSAENVTKAGMAKPLPSPGQQLKDVPVGVGALWVRDQSEAKVDLGRFARIKSVDLGLRAHNDASLEGTIASAPNSSQASNFTAIAFAITQANVQANVAVDKGADLQVSGNVAVVATNIGSYGNEVTSKTGPNGRAAAAIAYADHQSAATAKLGASVGDATGVSVLAINDVQKDEAVAVSKVGGALSVGQKIEQAVSDKAGEFFWSKLGLQTLKPNNQASPTQQSFRIGGAIAYDLSKHTASAEIGDSASVHATDGVAVVSRVRAEQTKIAAQAAAVSDSAQNPVANDTARQAYSVGLAVGDYTYDALSRIGIGAVVTASDIAVHSDTIMPLRDSLLFGNTQLRWGGLNSIMDSIDTVANVFDVFNGVSSAKSTSDNSDGSVNLSGSVSLLNYANNSRAIVDAGGRLRVLGNRTQSWNSRFELRPEIKHYLEGVLISTDEAVVEDFTFDAPVGVFAGHEASLLFQAGEPLPAKSGQYGLGVTFDQVAVTSVTEAVVREGAIIRGVDETSDDHAAGGRTWTQTGTHAAPRVDIRAKSDEFVLSLATAGGRGASFGANGTYSQMRLDSSTHALVDDEATVEASQFGIKADASPVLWSVSGVFEKAKNASVGIGVAINEATTNTRAEIADNDTWSTDGDARSSQANVADAAIKVPALSVGARTDGRIEAVALTGAIASDSPPDSTPGFFDGIKQKLSDGLAGVGALVGMKSGGGKPKVTIATQSKDKKPTSFGLAGAGSGAVNITELKTVAAIDGATIEQGGAGAASLAVNAVSDTDIGAFSGAGALARRFPTGAAGKDPVTAVALTGSVAVNSTGNAIEARLRNSKVGDAGGVTVHALSGGEQLAIGMGMALVSGAEVASSYSLVGSLSLTSAQTDDNGDTKDKVTALIDKSSITGKAGASGRDIDVTAYNRTYLGTGGGSLSLNLARDAWGGSIGGAVSWANIRNDVTSGIVNGSAIGQVDTVKVQAYNATEIGSGAAMVAYSGAERSESISAAVVVNQVTNHTTAAIERSSVNVVRSVEVRAKDTGADSALESAIDPDGHRLLAVKGLDYCAEQAGGASPSGNCMAAVAGTVQAGRGGNIGASVAYDEMVNDLTARVKDSSVTVQGVASTNRIGVEAESDVSIVGIAVGVGESGSLSGAGSISIAAIDNHVKSEVGRSASAGGPTSLAAAAVGIAATDASRIDTWAGQVNASIGNAALGAAVAYNDIGNEARSLVDQATIATKFDTDITAKETAGIASRALAGGYAKGAEIGLSGALNFIANTTEAALNNSSVETAGGVAIISGKSVNAGNINITATNASDIDALSGSAAFSGKAAVGVAVADNEIGDTTKAHISGGKDAASPYKASKSVIVAAGSDATLDSHSIGAGAAGKLDVGGSVAVNLVNDDTKAYIDDGAVVVAQHNVGVTADSNDKVSVIAGSSGVGIKGVAIGLSFSTSSIAGNTLAYIDGANTSVTGLAKDLNDVLTVYSGKLTSDVDLARQANPATRSSLDLKSRRATEGVTGIAVNAASSQSVESVSASADVGKVAAGLVDSIDIIGGKTQAYAQNASINTDNAGAGSGQRVAINSSNIAFGSSFVGNIDAGSAAVGVGEDIHSISRTTSAYGFGSSIAARDKVGIDSSVTQGVSSVAVGGAAGKIGGAGTLSMTLFDNVTEAYADGTHITAGSLAIKADQDGDMYALSGVVSAGGVAVGGAFSVASSDAETTASLKNAAGTKRADISGSVDIDAANTTRIVHTTISGAGAGSAAVAGMADVNLITDTTQAGIEGSLVGQSAGRAGAVHVGATHSLDIDSKAGNVAGAGIAGVGAGASVNVVKAQTTATIGNSVVYSSGLVDVSASSNKHVDARAATAGVGGTTGIGGAAVVALVGDDVKDDADKEAGGTLSAVDGFTNGSRDLSGAPLTDAEKERIDAATRKSTTGVTGSAGPYKYRTAAEVAGSAIDAGSLNVASADKSGTTAVAGGLGVGLSAVGIGGGVSVVSVKANVTAHVSGTPLTTTGNVTVRATADKDRSDAAIGATALTGGIGLVGIGAAVSHTELGNHVDAMLASGANAGTGTVSVTAEDRTDILSTAEGASAGAGAAGAVVSHAGKNSTVAASIGGTVTAAATDVSALGRGNVKALGRSAVGGAAASLDANKVDASDKSSVKAFTADSSVFKLGGGALGVTATATPQAVAEAYGADVAAGTSIGASIADATVKATVGATVGKSNSINAGKLTLQAQQSRNGTDASANAKAFVGSGGMLVGGSATVASAGAQSAVTSGVGDDSSLDLGTGAANVTATSDSKQHAEASGIAGSFLAVGYNDAKAASDNGVGATLGTGVKVAAQTLAIEATGMDDNQAKATSGAGGVFSGAAAFADTSTKSATSAALGSSIAGRDIRVGTFSLKAGHTSTFDGSVDSTHASILGASGAYATNRVDKAVVLASIGDGVSISAGSVDIGAINTVRKGKADQDSFNAVSASGGVFDAAAAHSETTVNNDTDVAIGSAVTIKSGDAININAVNDAQLYDAAKLDSGGAVALAKAESFIYNDRNDADIVVGAGSRLAGKKDITLESKTLALADTEVQSKTYGIAGAAQGASTSRIGTSNNIALNGARLESDENVMLRAGYDNALKADAETRLWNRTALPIETHPDAEGKITQDNRITIAAYAPAIGAAPTGATSEEQIARAAIATVKDIYLQAGEGSHTTRGYGRGTDLYRELIANAAALFGANISLDISGGSVTDDAVTGVEVNGTLFAGTKYHQFLHIDGNGAIVEQSDGMATPGRRSNVDLARDMQDRIDALQRLIDEYKHNTDSNANNADIVAGIQADIDILKARKSQLGVGAKADFIDIDAAAAYTGIIFATGDSLSGKGELLAPGDARIEIVNDSKSFLSIKSNTSGPALYIPDYFGGIVSLNGVRVSSTWDIDAINQRSVTSAFGKILDRQTSVDPMILVRNTYADPVNGNALNPEIHIDGDVSNLRGTVKVDSQGTIQVASNIYAKTVDIKTNGDFIQQFTVGFTQTGGDPTFNVPNNKSGQGTVVQRTVRNPVTGALETKFVPYTLDLYYEDTARDGHYTSHSDASGWRTASYSDTPSYDYVAPPSATIAGNNVFISGQKLNINSLIQSGLPLFNVEIGQDMAELAQRADGAWVALNMGEVLGTVLTRDWTGKTRSEQVVQPIDPVFQPKIRWQDGQIELQSLAVGGGYMQLYGDIFSTGGGKLKVLDGYGRISVKNDSIYNLAVNRLDTGAGVAGMIKITDTSTKDASGKPLVTTITRSNGMVTATYENLNSADARHPTVSDPQARTAQYDPRAGRRLHWFDSETIAMSYWETYDRECAGSCSFGNLADWLARDPGSRTGSGHADPVRNPRPVGEWLADDPNSRTAAYILDFSSYRSGTATNGPYKTGEYRSGLGGINEHITSKKDWSWTQYNYYDHSLCASHPIGIEFIGYDTGQLSVDAGGRDLAIQGALRNLTGSTSLSAANITAASQAIVSAKDLVINAKGIGVPSKTGASSYLKIDLQANGSLDAQAREGGMAIWEQDGDLTITRAQSTGGTTTVDGKTVSYGPGFVDLRADGDIFADSTVIAGSGIRLTSENGGIGYWAGTPVMVDMPATGNLEAAAAKSIFIGKDTGDLRLDRIASREGQAYLIAKEGSIIDDNNSARIDVETRDALLAVADRAGLRGDAAASSQQATISGYNAARQQDYARYWQMRNVKKNQDGSYSADPFNGAYKFQLTDQQVSVLKSRGWTDAQVSQYNDRQTKLYYDANKEFGAQPFDPAFRYDVQKQDPAGYQELIAGSTWTDAQIQNRIAAGIFKNTANTKVLIEDPNVTGQDILLQATKGSIGAEKSEISISLADPAAWTDAERLALVAADRKDVTIDAANKIIKVRVKDDIDIALGSGLLNAIAPGDIYIGSETDIRVHTVGHPSWDSQPNDVRIKTRGTLMADDQISDWIYVTAKDMTLEAGGGNLGTANVPFQINATGTLTARARDDLFVKTRGGKYFSSDMRLEQVYAGKGATLVSAGAILENPARYDFLPDIQAAQISLTAKTTIGEADATGLKYLDLVGDPLGWVDMTAPGGIYAYVPSGKLNLRSVNASDATAKMVDSDQIGIISLDSLNIVGSMVANGKTTLKAGRDLQFGGGSLTSYGGVDLQAGANGSGSLVVGAESSGQQAIYTYRLLGMKAADSITVDGHIFSGIGASVTAGGNIQFRGGTLAAYNGPVTMNAGSGGTGSIRIGAGDGATCAWTPSATLCGNSVALTAANAVVIEGQIQAAKGGITIHAGDDAHVKGGMLASGGNITLKTADNLTLGGGLLSAGPVHLEAGTDGSGSILVTPGHVTEGGAGILMAAPDGVQLGGGIRGSNVTLNAGEAAFDMVAHTTPTAASIGARHPGYDPMSSMPNAAFGAPALGAKALVDVDAAWLDSRVKQPSAVRDGKKEEAETK